MSAINIAKLIYNDLLYCVNPENIMMDEPMSCHTSFRVGGPADIYIAPQDRKELVSTLVVLTMHDYPYIIIGKGTDLLVRDGGIRGAVVDVTKLNGIYVDGTRITVEAGAPLKDVCNAALENSLTGMEFACGIPGTVGGAVYMNAGAYGGEIKDVLEWCEVLDKKSMKSYVLNNGEMEFGYRASVVQSKDLVVLRACFLLRVGDRETIKRTMDDLTRRRQEKQPLEYPSAGSVFKRPPGYYAGKLIEDAGLRGARIGDAQISEKHTGFIINLGNATASDVIRLIDMVQKTVKDKFGVDMYPEIKIIGEDRRRN
ncbi:UDP-N-acetylmuramate dehydrogenase [Calorimonas adulescens]|uniref:UDP-N-acetylenolpyruvoylglucosamine reductase n=2 Tax=Calorimonas adulescens TaxID=2606906 RepID=A0A5D8QF30_9THEO|nr:UDP-N-acetylmuramate dehydrogenase [Calorimonas adulescens]